MQLERSRVLDWIVFGLTPACFQQFFSIPAIIFWAVSGTAAENFRDFPGFSLDFRDAAVFGRKSCYALKILVAESITVSLRDRACSFLGDKRYINHRNSGDGRINVNYVLKFIPYAENFNRRQTADFQNSIATPKFSTHDVFCICNS